MSIRRFDYKTVGKRIEEKIVKISNKPFKSLAGLDRQLENSWQPLYPSSEDGDPFVDLL